MKALWFFAVLAGCSSAPNEIYPFPCSQDADCPVLDDFPSMVCVGSFGCVISCLAPTTTDCLDLNANVVDLDGRPAHCEEVAAAQEPVCLLECASDSDCGPSYRCSSVGTCILSL